MGPPVTNSGSARPGLARPGGRPKGGPVQLCPKVLPFGGQVARPRATPRPEEEPEAAGPARRSPPAPRPPGAPGTPRIPAALPRAAAHGPRPPAAGQAGRGGAAGGERGRPPGRPGEGTPQGPEPWGQSLTRHPHPGRAPRQSDLPVGFNPFVDTNSPVLGVAELLRLFLITPVSARPGASWRSAPEGRRGDGLTDAGRGCGRWRTSWCSRWWPCSWGCC